MLHVRNHYRSCRRWDSVMRKLPTIRLGFDRFSAVYLWIAFLVIFGIMSPHIFLTSSTLHLVASEQAVSGIMAIAILIPITCGQFDLSIGANANLTGIVAIVVQINWHWPAGLAVLLGVAVGALIGIVNGFLVVKLKINSFIATLAMGSILSAFVVIVTNSNQPPPVTSTAWNDLSQISVGGYQIVVVYLLALGLLTWWLLDYTPVGRYFYAIGGNAESARLAGVRVGRWTWTSLIISGTIAGFGGILYTSLSGPSLTFGSTLLLPAFAAAFLGSTQLQPGRFNIWGTLIAIYVLATGVEGLQLVSGQQWLGDMFNGVALIVAVGLAVARGGSIRAAARRRGFLRGAGPAGVAVGEEPDSGDSAGAGQVRADDGQAALAAGEQSSGQATAGAGH
jgi:ribose transport system permease protein